MLVDGSCAGYAVQHADAPEVAALGRQHLEVPLVPVKGGHAVAAVCQGLIAAREL